jgi:hypothetical protein
MEITIWCFVDEHLAWCLLQSVIRDDHRHCQPMRPILEVSENAKSSTAIAQIERDLKYIDASFEKIKSDITNNISDTRLVLQCFFATDTTPNLETSFTKDSNSDEMSSFSSKRL